MEIKQEEVKDVKKIGTLNGSEVKLITLKGGFHIGMGKKTQKSNKSEILAVGSHPALISYQIEKSHGLGFEQSMEKSEGEVSFCVENLSHNLNSSQQNVIGLDIYAIKKNEEIEFQITKHKFEIFSIYATEVGGEIVLNKTEKNLDRLAKLDKKELSVNLEKAIKEYANKNKLTIKKEF